jgi:hypothetical protein
VRSQSNKDVKPFSKKPFSVMRFVVLAISLVALAFVPASVAQAASTWGLLHALPLATAYVPGQITSVNAMSCSSVGNCSAGGIYSTKTGEQAFVVNEKRGSWGSAAPIPGVSSLDIGGSASLTSMSCGSAGNCSAVGTYQDGSYNAQAFAVNETGGTWGTAVELPGLAALGADGATEVSSISCASVGNCAVGFSTGSGEGSIVGVATETAGTWSSAGPLPGFAALSGGSGYDSFVISCGSPGNCGVSGTYDDDSGQMGFVDNEISGVWSNVAAVPGLSQLDVLSEANFESISCSGPGDCSAGGSYAATLIGSTYFPEAFVVSEMNGVWGNAIEVPGTPALNVGGDATVSSVSCSSLGDCDAVGTAKDAKGLAVSFSSTETGGMWKPAIQLFSGTTTAFVSCKSGGNCAAATSNLDEVLTKNESNGVWGSGSAMFGPLVSNVMSNINLTSLSCAGDGSCGAGGSLNVLEGLRNISQAFVLNSSASGSAKTTVPSAPRIAVTSPTKGALDVTIDGAFNTGGRAITDYEAVMSVSGTVVAYETWTAAYGNVLPLDSFTPGSYGVRLREKNALGWGPYSSAHTVTVR